MKQSFIAILMMVFTLSVHAQVIKEKIKTKKEGPYTEKTVKRVEYVHTNPVIVTNPSGHGSYVVHHTTAHHARATSRHHVTRKHRAVRSHHRRLIRIAHHKHHIVHQKVQYRSYKKVVKPGKYKVKYS